MTTRRSLLSAGAASLALATRASAMGGATIAPSAAEIRPLWAGDAPGSSGVTVQPRTVPRRADSGPEDVVHYAVTRPTLGIVRPLRPNGRAVLVIPGGGYERVAAAASGGTLARYLAGRGYLVGTLIYRLPYDGWAAGPAAPLQDAQRAFRLLKQQAGTGQPVGVMGFSAGGHLAGMLATRFRDDSYDPVDPVDSLAARPAFAGLFFPVITMTDPHAHRQSRLNLIGADASPALIADWSVERHVSAGMPPCFIGVSADDRTVRAENSLMMFAALRARNVPAALHIFDIGDHGFGKPGDPSGPGRFWPDLFEDWVQRQNLT